MKIADFHLLKINIIAYILDFNNYMIQLDNILKVDQNETQQMVIDSAQEFSEQYIRPFYMEWDGPNILVWRSFEKLVTWIHGCTYSRNIWWSWNGLSRIYIY